MRNVEDNNDNVVYRSKAKMPCLYRFVCCVSVLLLCYCVQMTLNLLAEKLDPSKTPQTNLGCEGDQHWLAIDLDLMGHREYKVLKKWLPQLISSREMDNCTRV